VREEGRWVVQQDVDDIIRDEEQEVNGAVDAIEIEVTTHGQTIDIPIPSVPGASALSPELLRYLSEPNKK
jgi:hypothetical protein